MDVGKALTTRRSAVRTCTALVALTLVSCQSGPEQALSSSSAPPAKSSAADNLNPNPPAPAGEGSNPWVGRSGEAEALADLANGRPVKLYTHVYGGERAGFRSPGLLYCDPEQNIGNKAAENLFAFIPEANMSEGVIYTLAQQARQRSASSFARSYNLTMFSRKYDYIVQLCPKVELESLLRGSRITQPDRRESYMRTPEEFHKNGSYVRHEDNFEAHGKYSFKDDAVCAQAEQDPEVCRRVLIDKDGRYWIVGRYNPRLVERISVKPLR